MKLTKKKKNLNSPLQLAMQTETPTSLYSSIIYNRVKLKLNADNTSSYTSQFWKPNTVKAAESTFPCIQPKVTELNQWLGEILDCIWAGSYVLYWQVPY